MGRFGYTPNYGRTIARLAPDFDVAVVHGLWNHATVGGHAQLTAAGLPWLVFPHGMMDPYFRREKPLKHWVKQVFWTLWQGRVLSRAKAVLFTCEEERLLARDVFWGHRRYSEKVVAFCASDMGNGSEGREAFASLLPKVAGRDYLLYLGRIHPKKACDHLIEGFAQVSKRHPDIDLVIAGPDQVGWQPELQRLAARLGVSDRLHWPGMLTGSTRAAAFTGARAFVLPSHQENFGLVVAEALSAGTPVLISDKVNIWREVSATGAGLVAPDTVTGTANLLGDFLSLSAERFAAMRSAARRCYDTHFSVPRAAAELEGILAAALKPTGSLERGAKN